MSPLSPPNQLGPHCTRLLNSLDDGRTSQKEKLLYEQTLWNEVKKIRTLQDSSVYLYLIGYYHTILYHIAGSQSIDDLFQYHILIRLGDLNRYLNKIEVSEYYYCNARNLFPYFGHAYNQLGLLTKPTNCFKCCYYYVRAATSTYRPLNTIADSNLRIAVSKYNCELLNHILNERSSINIKEYEKKNLPRTALEWFYAIIVAFYADNVPSIARAFLDYMKENFSTQRATTIRDDTRSTTIDCDRESYILLSTLDVLLDWLKLSSRLKESTISIKEELGQIRLSLKTIAHSMTNEWRLNSLSADSSTTSCMDTPLLDSSVSSNLSSDVSKDDTGKATALPHDYILRGFSPLESVHNQLVFGTHTRFKSLVEDDLANDNTDHLFQIMSRVKTKIDQLGINVRRRTRNIALESILSNMNANHQH